jgi:hypothetical protein
MLGSWIICGGIAIAWKASFGLNRSKVLLWVIAKD